MNLVTRGVRNAFRNGIRTVSIVIILGLSIGLCLIMLVAHKAVETKISSVKSSIGNTISIAPAGLQGFEGGGNPLAQSNLTKLKSLANVTGLSEAISDRLTTGTNTTLISSITAGSLGQRFGREGGSFGGLGGSADSTSPLPTFTPPISASGSTDTSQLNGTSLKLISGSALDGSRDTNAALIGKDLATKNNLQVGSTFTAYNTTITVAGIFDTGTSFSNNAVLFSLPTLQRLSNQPGNITSATLTVNSITNVDSVTAAVKKALGSSADVTSSKTTAQAAIAPLDSVKTISLVSLIGAVIAGAVIILLTMIMIVRERKREIGVLKAIGDSNLRIMSEFMVEALTLAVLGAVIGLIIGVVGAQPVTKLLVNNSSNQTITTNGFPAKPTGNGGFSRASGTRPIGGFSRRFGNTGATRSLDTIKTQLGWGILLDGFGTAILISVIGSALAAGMIAKVRPSEVMRSI